MKYSAINNALMIELNGLRKEWKGIGEELEEAYANNWTDTIKTLEQDSHRIGAAMRTTRHVAEIVIRYSGYTIALNPETDYYELKPLEELT